jgi:isopenicillin N synthase-like dioxygenase
MTVILSSLSMAVNLPDGEKFESMHRIDAASKTELEFLKYAGIDAFDANVGFSKHTDTGSLTILFTQQSGLQIFCPTHSRWEVVTPRPNLAIVNVGDTLSALSGGKLRSVIHRVVPVHGASNHERFSTGYFLRAANSTVIKNSEGIQQTVLQYYDNKFQIYQQPLEMHAKTSIITGGMEDSGVPL